MGLHGKAVQGTIPHKQRPESRKVVAPNKGRDERETPSWQVSHASHRGDVLMKPPARGLCNLLFHDISSRLALSSFRALLKCEF